MKFPVCFLIVIFFLFPSLSFSADIGGQCSPTGYTIATINGIFTDDVAAKENKDALEYRFDKEYRGENLKVDYLHNPPHLGGVGDIFKSIYQGIFDSETVEDYDLVEMLQAASEKIATQKLLLVAHSQGNFYANSFYDTVADNAGGVPAESISVYSVATPSGRVAGGGKWITSDTDKIIAGVVGHVPFRKIMEPNTHIELQNGDDSLGHNFSGVYLKYQADKIVSDIKSSLDQLKTNNVQDAQKPCLVPPKLSTVHKIEGAVFAVADPIANAMLTVAQTTVSIGTNVVKAGVEKVVEVAQVIKETFSNVFKKDQFQLAQVVNLSQETQSDQSGQTQSQPASPNQCSFDTQKSASHSKIIINEVAWMGGISNVNDEWIELKNISGSSLNISGYQLLDRGEQIKIVFDKNTVIPAGGFFLLERNGDEAVPSVKADLIYQGALSNTDEGLRLFDASCNLIDEVLANPKWPAGDNVAKKTMERNISDLTWHASRVVSGTPKKENSQLVVNKVEPPIIIEEQEEVANLSEESEKKDEEITPQQEDAEQQEQVQQSESFKQCNFNTNQSAQRQGIIINEVAWMGTANSANDEWIELKNISGGAIDVSNWQILDKDEQIKIKFDSGSQIPASGFYLLERTDDNTVLEVKADKIYTGGLSNSNEGLRLFDGQCSLIDEVLTNSGSDGKQWLAGDNIGKNTMERKSDFNWQTSANVGGTPKKENSSGYVSYGGGGGGGTPTNNQQQTNNNSSSTPAKILITEVQITGGSGKTENDFIELYNPNSSPVNLNGYRLVKRTKTGTTDSSIKSWTTDTLMPAYSYYLWADSGYADIPVSADVTTSVTISNDNGIAIRFGAENTGTVIDSVAWGEAQNTFIEGSVFPNNPAANQSIQRKFQNNTFIDTDNNAQDFEVQTCPSPKAQSKSCTAANQVPSAFFVYTPANPIVGDLVTFDAASSTDPDGSIVSYQWDFGDNTTSTISITTTTHSYSQVGDYQVSLIVFDSQNTSSAATSTISVSSIEQSNQAPNVSFNYSPQNPKVGDVITFNAASSIDPDGQIIFYQWDFGDNTTSSLTIATTTYFYFQAGDYLAKLTVFDNRSASSTATSVIRIEQGETNHIVVSEILFDVLGPDEGKEFIELYNPTNSDVDSESWSLRILKNNTTSTDLLVKLGSKTEDITLIKSKSFLLIGFDNYNNSPQADAIRSASLPNSTSTIYLLDNNSVEIDAVTYNKEISEGQSFERKFFYNNQCVSAQNDGEFLGNGCDTDNNNADFEIRQTPNPQNSQNLPEPRNAPTPLSNFDIQYSTSTMELIFNWDASSDYSGDISNVAYKITDISDASSTLATINTASTTTKVSINEVGRDYKFSIQAFDKEGLGSTTTTKEITVPPPTPTSQTVLYSQNVGDTLSQPFRWENYYLMTELEQQTEPLTLLQSGQPFTVKLKAYQDWNVNDAVYLHCPSAGGYRAIASPYASSTWNSDTKILTIQVNSNWWLFGTDVLCGVPQGIYIQVDYNRGYQFYGSVSDIYLSYDTMWHDNYWNSHQIDTNINDLYFVIEQEALLPF